MPKRFKFIALSLLTAALFSCSQAVDIDTCRTVEDPYTLVSRDILNPFFTIVQDGDPNGIADHSLDIRYRIYTEVDSLGEKPRLLLSLNFARRKSDFPDNENILYVLDSMRIELPLITTDTTLSLADIGSQDDNSDVSGFRILRKNGGNPEFKGISSPRDSSQFRISTQSIHLGPTRQIDCEISYRTAIGNDSLSIQSRFTVDYRNGSPKVSRTCD